MSEDKIGIVSVDHLDQVDFEQEYLPLGVRTKTCEGRWQGLDFDELLTLENAVEHIQGSQLTDRLIKLRRFLTAARRWAAHNTEKMK